MEREGRNSPEERRRNLPRILGAAVAVLAFVLAFVVLAPSTPPAPDESVNSADSVTEPTSSQPDQARSSGGLVEAPGQVPSDVVIGEGTEYVDGELVVRFDSHASVEAVNAALSAMPCIADVEVTQSDIEAGFALLPVAEGYGVSDAIVAMREVDGAMNPQPNYVYRLADDGVSSLTAGTASFGSLGVQETADYWDVNDPQGRYDAATTNNWHLKSIHAYEAWKTVRSDQGAPCVTVAIIDSGCNLEHEDLKANIIGSYDATGRYENYNSGMADGADHGTHVAGIVAAVANNNTGTAGVSYNARILPIQVFHSQKKSDGTVEYSATSVSLGAAYEYIEQTNETHPEYNIRVANLSVGANMSSISEKDQLALDAIEAAYEKGVLTVCAASNSTNNDKPFVAYPASYLTHGMSVIALANTNGKLELANYSNYNTGVTRSMDISAPGSGITSTRYAGDYSSKSGTSMATPIVSGVAALLFTANPSLTPDDVIDIIHSTATDLTPENSSSNTSEGFDQYTGYGEVNAKAAVDSASIYLSGDSALLVGGSMQLSVTGVTNGGSVSWSSDNAGIATVTADGTVVGKAGGTTAIRAKVGERTITKTVTVYDISYLLPSGGIADECEMLVGESIDLTFKENPDTGLWIIDTTDASVATAHVPGDGTITVKATGPGEACITATLKENSNLVVRLKVSVIGSTNQASLASTSASITWPFLDSSGNQVTTYYYSGSAIKPVPTQVVYSFKRGDTLTAGKSLQLGTDYTLSYSNNVNAGIAKVNVNGKGSYTGSVPQEFAITPTPLTHSNMAATVPSVSYTGGELKPVPTLKLSINGTYTLRQGVDFVVSSYSDNVNVGVGSVTVKGIGNFSGERTIDFVIVPASLSGATVTVSPASYVYDGKAKTPAVTVRLGGRTLAAGSDYTVSYANNVNAGTATVTVSGVGNYQGSKKASFAITAAGSSSGTQVIDSPTTRVSLSGATVTVSPASYVYDGKAKTPAVTVRLGGRTLAAGSDYTVSYANNVNAGTATVTVTGRGNYQGTRSTTFTISQTDAQKGHRVTYRTHVQNVGWQGYVTGPSVSGTSGRSLRLEGINISLADHPYAGSIQYRTHIQNIGWESGWRSDGAMSGTSGRSLRLEAIQVRLTGAMAAHYDVYYRVHCQNIGWMGWAKNGASAGTAGFAYRLEAIQVQLVPKGSAAPGSTSGAFRDAAGNLSGVPDSESGVLYRTHVQNVGWQNYMRDGEQAGTSGRSLRLEGINIKLGGTAGSGGITYRTHVQNIGWQGWCSNGAMSGTSGRSLRLEAIEVKLTGAAATRYDVYYRVHCQNIGWMGWAKNGQAAGTAGYAYRLEAIQVKLVPKGSAAPGTTADHFRSR